MQIKTERMKKAMFLIVFAIVTGWLFYNIKFIGVGLSFILGILAPFIIGLVIAFIFNKPMNFIEGKLFYKDNIFGGLKGKYKRPLSFFITLLLFIIIVAIVIILVIPNLVDAGQGLADKLPMYWENVQEYAKNASIKYTKINDFVQDVDFEELSESAFGFVKSGFSNWFGSTVSVFSSVIGGITSVALGIVFSVYFLLQKEELIMSVKKFTYAVFKLNIAENLDRIATLTSKSFSQFLTGQTLDALALGAMFLISMLIFRFPYALMVSVIITISGFIPIVGAFVGLIIGVFVIFIENPKMAGLFIILFFILQQIESNIIYPKVVGKASGLSSVWILAAITLGGSLMGIVGIMIFVPMFSVIQQLLQEYIDKRLEEKNMTLE